MKKIERVQSGRFDVFSPNMVIGIQTLSRYRPLAMFTNKPNENVNMRARNRYVFMRNQ